jgi:hypothetical protein
MSKLANHQGFFAGRLASMATLSPREFGPRLRAALALKGWTVAELADAIPPEYRLSKETIYALQQGKRAPKEWEPPLLAEKLGVPEWFLTEGFTAPRRHADERPPGEQVELARRLLGEVRRILEELGGSE